MRLGVNKGWFKESGQFWPGGKKIEFERGAKRRGLEGLAGLLLYCLFEFFEFTKITKIAEIEENKTIKRKKLVRLD